MVKLSRKQAEEALHLKEEGLGYRKIEKRLKEKYGEENAPAYSTISKKLKPVLEGDKTLDDVFSEDKEDSEGEQEDDEIEQGGELKVEHEPKSVDEGEDGYNRLLYIMWIAFFILVMILLVI